MPTRHTDHHRHIPCSYAPYYWPKDSQVRPFLAKWNEFLEIPVPAWFTREWRAHMTAVAHPEVLPRTVLRSILLKQAVADTPPGEEVPPIDPNLTLTVLVKLDKDRRARNSRIVRMQIWMWGIALCVSYVDIISTVFGTPNYYISRVIGSGVRGRLRGRACGMSSRVGVRL